MIVINTINMSSISDKDYEDEDFINKILSSKGLSGLTNMGNTCYMNAGLQCLFASPLLSVYFLKKKFTKQLKSNTTENLAKAHRKLHNKTDDDEIDFPRSELISKIKQTVSYAYYKTIKGWIFENYDVEPVIFKENIGTHNALFVGWSQNDSQELINCTLDTLHEELKMSGEVEYKDIDSNVLTFRNGLSEYIGQLNNADITDDAKARVIHKLRTFIISRMYEYVNYVAIDQWNKFIRKDYSIIREIFSSMLYTEITCKKCNIPSLNFELALMLTLCLPKDKNELTLDDCLEFNYCSKEFLTNKDQYQCTNCKSYNDAEKVTYIWELPELLIIHFKRFSNEMIGRMCRMRKDGAFVKYPLKSLDMSKYLSKYNKKSAMYDLYGVVHHHGSLNGGHYTASCRSFINQEWFNFNDSSVSLIHRENDIVSESGYILFYQKRYDEIDDSE